MLVISPREVGEFLGAFVLLVLVSVPLGSGTIVERIDGLYDVSIRTKTEVLIMDTMRLTENIGRLDELKKDASITQKKGLPFIMSSVIIWSLILAVQFLDKAQVTKNLYTFMCSCYLMPLAFMFSKITKADIFKKTSNPINKLGFLCTMNQTLYLIIVMWAFNRSPEATLMLYAMVFGAHLLPFGWVYNSLAYKVVSVIETIGALLIALSFGNAATCVFMIVMEIILCICLFIENKKLMNQ